MAAPAPQLSRLLAGDRALNRLASLAGVTGLVAVACTVNVGERGVSNLPGEEVWKTEVELHVGEVAHVDGRGLEVTLIDVGADEATLSLVSSHEAGERQVSLAGAEAKVRPYRVKLVSIEAGESVIIEVRREWGEWRP